MAHFENQWNEPDLQCHYLMQISADIKNLFSKKWITVFSRKLDFKTNKDLKKPIDEDQKKKKLQQSKSFWSGFAGLGKRSNGK